ncbi:hypothetical protein [Flavihumibacter solisilvae]|uniref:Uncharacterized protein n=1 Tax=Flavihumibacter solisilvae TaxID=1349421 RepID=A0A0C1LIP1_9BACT|nr:hypothetical protein [Flavihumibacter solisilvae]KIC95273.1 hypothetical protein OI18_06540 [Flavihumibacter solisilvae]
MVFEFTFPWSGSEVPAKVTNSESSKNFIYFTVELFDSTPVKIFGYFHSVRLNVKESRFEPDLPVYQQSGAFVNEMVRGLNEMAKQVICVIHAA